MVQNSSGENNKGKAEELFDDFIEKHQDANPEVFEDVCQDNPDLEPALRALHSLYLDQGDLETSSEMGTRSVGGPLSLDVSQLGQLSDRSPSLQDLVPGKEIGPYRLERLLGEGGFGLVFLAQQQQPVKRQVALKVIKAGMDTQEVIRRFEAERQALASMDHPNISTVYDFGATDRGRPYFVMEYVTGEPIHKWCDKAQLSIDERIHLFLQVCDAIQHAHQRAIIHRDIKPSNILIHEVDGKPIPKVIDFGIAKATADEVTGDSQFTQAGQIVGTPVYMSPEQAEGDPQRIDVRTDVYSLGVLFYELLTGLLPLDKETFAKAKNIAEIQKLIIEKEPLRPSVKWSQKANQDDLSEESLNRGISINSLPRKLRGDLDWITLKALEKDRDRRYGSVQEFADDLRRHLEHRPVKAGPPSQIYVLKKYLRKNRLAVSIVLGALILVLGLMGVQRLNSIQDAQNLVELGDQSFKNYYESQSTLEELQEEYRTTSKKFEPWQPPWERPEEFEILERLEKRESEISSFYSNGIRYYNQAMEVAPTESQPWEEARNLLADIYFNEMVEVIEGRGFEVPPEFYQDRIQDLGVHKYDSEFNGSGKITISASEPNVDVYAFKYERIDQRLIPIPILNALNLDRKNIESYTGLVVDKIHYDNGRVFQVGDELLSVAGHSIHTRSDLAKALKGKLLNQSIPVQVMRSINGNRKEVQFSWIPFPEHLPEELQAIHKMKDCPYEAGRLVYIQHQLGISFQGYPLFFRTANIGTLNHSHDTLELELPRGSYLFCLKKVGFSDLRYPVSMPANKGLHFSFRIKKSNQIPENFVYIPKGPSGLGGDKKAFQPLERQQVEIGDFYIGKFEITVGEYLRFLNSEEVLKNTTLKGRWTGFENSKIDDPILIVPVNRIGSRTLLLRNKLEDKWSLNLDRNWRLDWPIIAINRRACYSYIDWRNRTESKGWKYRLPTDQEWEKAARGSDRRIYVWGNRLSWTFCWNPWASFQRFIVLPVGTYPMDESIFGVRDMAGSASEYTVGRPDPNDESYHSYRGGSWFVNQEFYFRVATRNGLGIKGFYTHSGFRLVAERQPSSSDD